MEYKVRESGDGSGSNGAFLWEDREGMFEGLEGEVGHGRVGFSFPPFVNGLFCLAFGEVATGSGSC